MEVQIRKADKTDLDEIMALYDAARGFMRKDGNSTQWVNGYPQRHVVEADIEAGNQYVAVGEDNNPECTFALVPGYEPTYVHIEDGEWLDDKPYATVHRMASSGRIPHISDRCLDFCFTVIDTIRVDTHADNQVMHQVMKRNGFCRCGIIYVADGTPRIAFHKSISKS